jgi:hypothetical protein
MGEVVNTREPDEYLQQLAKMHAEVRDFALDGSMRHFRCKRAMIDLGRCRLLRTAASSYRMHIVEERRAAGRFRYRPVAQGMGGAALPNSKDRDRRQL